MKTKVCSKCKKLLSEENFCSNRASYTGKSNWCKECHNKAAIEWNRKNKQKLNLKRRIKSKEAQKKCIKHYGGKCAICKTSESKLCVDHINGKKEEGVPESGRDFWFYLIKMNFPPGYRVLCQRCNVLDGALRSHPLLHLSGIDELIQRLNIPC